MEVDSPDVMTDLIRDQASKGAQGTAFSRPHILHVSGDFPDTIDGDKTSVIKSHVLSVQAGFDNHVISINRRDVGALGLARSFTGGLLGPSQRVEAQSFPFGDALIYHAPGRGILHQTSLERLADWIGRDTERLADFDLFVGHKLTIEGMVIHRLSERLAKPFAICIQGDTDLKILSARPDLRQRFARVFHEAAMVFAFSPWAMDRVEEKLGRRSEHKVVLPCPTELDRPLTPTVNGSGIITAFHLKNARRKNLQGLARAMQLLEQKGAAPALKVIGGGSADDEARCRSILRPVKNAELVGHVARADIAGQFNSASAFVMPSLRESFGLVFVEALFAGVPVIYPKGMAVSGYFEDQPFALAADPKDPRDIASKIGHLIQNEREVKLALADWHNSEDAKRFMRPQIAKTFSAGLSRALRVAPVGGKGADWVDGHA